MQQKMPRTGASFMAEREGFCAPHLRAMRASLAFDRDRRALLHGVLRRASLCSRGWSNQSVLTPSHRNKNAPHGGIFCGGERGIRTRPVQGLQSESKGEKTPYSPLFPPDLCTDLCTD